MAAAAAEPTALQLDDARKIFVSRVPRTFDSEALRACLERALGDGGGGSGGSGGGDIIEKAEVIWDEEEDCNKGWGFVVFYDAAQRSRAVQRGTVKVKKHNMHLQEVERHREGRGRDRGGICFLWKQGTCTHGEHCRFAHDGAGACAASAAATPEEQARKKRAKKKKIKCFAFRKGKCKLGDACEYSHDFDPSKNKEKSGSSAAGAGAGAAAAAAERGAAERKPCFNWKKKGKCRKGDKCPYLHLTAEEIASRSGGSSSSSSSGGGDGSNKNKKRAKKRKRQDQGGGASGGANWSAIRPGDSYDAEPGQVRVFGMPYSATEEDVRAFFSSCPGTIDEFDMPLWEDSGRSKGFCGLKFSSDAGVAAALALDGQDMGGRWLRIQRGKMFSSWGGAGGEGGAGEMADGHSHNKRNKIGDADEAGDATADTSSSSSSSSGAAAAAAASNKTKNTRTVFLGNLDWALSKRALRRACEAAYGKVSSVRLQKPTKEQQEQQLHKQQSKGSSDDADPAKKSNNSGFAHVTFATEEIAQKAVGMNGQEFLGRVARVDFAYTRPAAAASGRA
jgi:RNA recognition motif-containing protein